MSNRRRSDSRRSPYFGNTVLWLVLMIALIVGLWLAFDIKISWAFLAGANLAAFFLMGVDKIAARADARRIPELILYWAFAFGPIGGLVGMFFFRHKVSKGSFIVWILLILLIQLTVLIYWFAPKNGNLLTLPSNWFSGLSTAVSPSQR